MKIAMIGAGAMGCLYGAYLSAKNEVILIDSFLPQVDAINKNGLIMLENGHEITFPMRAVPSKTDIGTVDLVIVLVNSIRTFEALEANQSLIGDHTIVMTLQNGMENECDMNQFVKKENIIIGTSGHSSEGVGLGKIQHTGSGITSLCAMVPSSHIDIQIAALLNEAGLEVEVTEHIKRIPWSKLVVTISFHSLTNHTEIRSVM
jgi:2-dehydropantoate 2-reductase